MGKNKQCLNAIYFREVPRLKQRIAGKSLPIEKFAVFKAKRFIEQNGYLTLPALVGLETFEPPRGKTNNVVSEQVRHKPTCTSTEKS